MSLNRLLTGAAAAVLAFGALTAPASATTHPDPPLDPTVPKNGGVYISKAGVATIKFAPSFTEKIKKLGAKLRFIEPWYPLKEGWEKGFAMPVGSDLDTFTDPNRVTYPGGLVIEDYKGNSIAVHGVWLRFLPGGFYGAPWVNGKKVKDEAQLLSFSLAQGALTGNVLTPHGGGIGPTSLELKASKDLATMIDQVAEVPPESGATKPYLKPGEHVGVIDVVWRDKNE